MKNILYGLLSSFIFGLIVLIIFVPIGSSVFVGDPFTISFHLFTYMGLIVLCGVIVTCTLFIVEKLNIIINEISIKESEKK